MMLSKNKMLFVWIVFTITFGSCASSRFTLPVLPDTQGEVSGNQQMLYSQLNWLAKAKDSLRIPVVLHVGDLVNFDTITHYQFASQAFKILDNAKLPYAITLGNHDTEAVLPNNGSAAPGNTNVNVRKTTKFNTWFPVSRFSLQVSRYEKGKSDNAAYIFKAGGKKWLVITLEFCAREGAAQWMNKTMQKYPKHHVIVLTHYHLTPKGEVAPGNAGYGDMKVKDIFDEYIRPNKNAFMVLSGHVCYTAHRTDRGVQGNMIYQVLQDYQCKDDGGGYIRLLHFDLKKKAILSEMYSPYFNKTLKDSSAFLIGEVKFKTKQISRPLRCPQLR